MKKIIISVFLLTLFPCITHAATSCPSDATLETCSTNPGCYWNEATATCTLCPAGTYNVGGSSNKNKTACTSCGDLGNNVSWTSQTGIEAPSNCAWSATCNAGEYLDGYKGGCTKCKTTDPDTFGPTSGKFYSGNTNQESSSHNSFSTDCQKCGTNASPNASGTNCDCNSGYHKTGGTNSDKTDVGTANCVMNTMTITLHPNYNPKNDNGMYYFSYARHYPYDEPASTTITVETTGMYNPANVALPQDWTRIGWEFVCWSPYTFYSSSDENCFGKGNHQNTTYYAKWRPLTYQINYFQDETDTTAEMKTCTFGTWCALGTPAMATAPAGKEFQHWTCDMNDDASVTSGCTQTKIAGGSQVENGIDISVIKEPVKYLSDTDKTFAPYKIYGVWSPCPAGYYCTPYRYECPAGTTSDAGSDEKKDCYMLGGATKIQGNNGTFILPAGLKLYYQGS